MRRETRQLRWLLGATLAALLAAPAGAQNAQESLAQTRAALLQVRQEVKRLRAEVGRTRDSLRAAKAEAEQSRKAAASAQAEVTRLRGDLQRQRLPVWAGIALALLLGVAALLRSRPAPRVDTAAVSRVEEDARRLREALDAAEARAQRVREG